MDPGGEGELRNAGTPTVRRHAAGTGRRGIRPWLGLATRPPAGDWDGKLNDLVRAFWTTRYNDDDITGNGLFIWAYWPVALAFGARTVAGRRSVPLNVWQRPSDGRLGRLHQLDWKHRAHSFQPGQDDLPVSAWLPDADIRAVAWPMRLTVAQAAEQVPQVAGTTEILLLRVVPMRWGPLPAPGWAPGQPTAPAPDAPPELTIADHARLGLRSGPIRLREWRCVTRTGVIPWPAYPTVVREAARWILATTQDPAADPATTWLLATQVPQEISLGLGLYAGALPAGTWPDHLWPVNRDPHGTFVAPRLNLGSAALRPADARR